MSLSITGKDGLWIVLNEPALRTQVVRFFFRDEMNPPPSSEELYPRTPIPPSGLDIGDTHWALARTAFAARPNLMQMLRPEVARAIAAAEDTRDYADAHPAWIPDATWRAFREAPRGVHRYANASHLNTDIILIKRNANSGYAEMPVNLQQVQRMLGVIPPSTLERIFTGDTVENSRARWLKDANIGYNHYMWGAVNQGMSANEALASYRNEVYQRFLRAYLPLIGGSIAAHPAGMLAEAQPVRDGIIAGGNALRSIGFLP